MDFISKRSRNKNMCHKIIPIALLLVLMAGCSSSTTENATPTASETPAAAQATAQTKAPPPAAPPAESFAPEKTTEQKTAKPFTAKAQAEPDAAKAAPYKELEKAQVGSGDKGRGYGQGIIATPVATYFAARERIMFEITVPDAIRAFKFENNFKGPKSHDEFMKMVIKKNNINLPTLPPGHVYVYDPKSEQLMVEKPQQ
jgi:hypothetical protein